MEFEERYFREELDYLRQLSKLLATEKPHLARFLAEKDADPDIERLLEGVAFLTGNLRQKIEDEFPELTHGLIKMLWPNYLRPVPAMTLIEYTPDMDKSSVPVLIPRNEQFTTNAGEIRVDEVLPSDAKKEEPPPCTFTLCRDIWLLPVRLEQIENRSTTRNGVINITFSVAPGTDFRTLDLNKLRFWLGNDDNYTRDQLYLWFCEYLQGADLTVGEQHLRLPEFMLKAVGFEPQDAMLPWPKNVHSGYRILQEYFCYPDAFLFFDLCGCPALPDGLQAEFFTLQLRFSRPLPVDIRLRRDSLRLYCAPAINLFIGPYVEQTYLQLLEQRYLPSLFNGLVKAMNAAPPESEEKLAVLRVMRMLEDKSGRNNEVVKQYMAKRWSEKFHGQRDIQAQLMSHLDYALAHTDWHAERQAGDGDAISRWTPYDKPVVSAQKELSKLPVYQRVYQSLKTRALGVLPADLNLRDQVGPTFDQVFTSADDNKLVVPQFLTRYGLQSYFVKQRDELVELTAMDSWVLNLTRSVKYSDADRAEIQRQLTEQYISDYTATWRAGMDNLNIRNFESIGQLTGALEQVISGDQPLQRALTVLRDNTQPGVFSEKLSAKEREEALAEPDYQLLTRLGHEFAPENSTLAVQKDKESTMQAVYQQLTELHRYLLAIQNAPVPGKSALKAVQLRLDQNSSDPIFATRQMAKTLPAPLNRWVGRLTDQAWHVVMVEAVHYMEVDWRDSVVKPFNEQLANNYPFNPRSAQDASLDAFERFFKPDGILDTFYQQNLKLFIDNDLSLEDGDNNVIIREDIIAQLETAQKIRDIFFSKQNGLGTSFAVETVSLSGNKRRSVLNLDGQLVDYSQGRNYTAHLVWPNNMREGNESKLTLIGTSGNAPRSISFSGPWAQFRLFGAGQLTGVQDGNFTVRFSVDGGAMTYRVHTDTEDNPFSGGLFSQFGLSDTLY
ncbi:TPA: type VI secretion system membrane subunit TssM [Escherichia coli]|uniref:type VI secretion system membrane subunit TssM n=3 Tax=Escherichia coli TaxID=562 RepID=UPI0006A65839|nr:type VI secretion system membrane subunit TssM [Escherichia coli]EFH5366645.1 type VI secretion system membrane subunit TssM [Escherichia coli]EFN0083093.1 type VI secretion system membrane subunit TssM [Escherichia coli]EFN5953341.1 type VI secretion system membrane subunit TssM [Escherichia coli]EFT2988630.1 type VI secretion system membrane subunit TssM [Escherichia coli]EGF4748860.1 type VI secretion system membrane subunit TssM [Escherichia coli]